jgi:hypothetical protein
VGSCAVLVGILAAALAPTLVAAGTASGSSVACAELSFPSPSPSSLFPPSARLSLLVSERASQLAVAGGLSAVAVAFTENQTEMLENACDIWYNWNVCTKFVGGSLLSQRLLGLL